MDVPPRGSRLARYIEMSTADDAGTYDLFKSCANPAERLIYAHNIVQRDPNRPWKWPLDVVAEHEIRPLLRVLMGEEAGDAVFETQPVFVEYLAQQEAALRYQESSQEQRNGRPPSFRDFAVGIVMAVLDDELESDPQRSENALCVAVAKRLGPGITREVIRPIYRGVYRDVWASAHSKRSQIIILTNFALRKWMKEADREIARGCVRNPRQHARGNAQS
ncbi:hypothetical protein [Paracoccus sp. (in: a-proteobacteria)]|uniref:hypothetical protein n=1 Tax=Paracoccus sp. TaxID=267 RepID=UPI0035B36C2F